MQSKSQRGGSRPTNADSVSSDEWFARYLLNAVLLVVLMLTALAVALYLDRGQDPGDRGNGPGAGFLACLLLCPMLAVAALGLVFYAGIRLFLRPRTVGHALVRLAFLVAHVCVFFVCVATMLSTTTAVLRRVGPASAARDPREALQAMASENYPGSQAGERHGGPGDSSFSPPPNLGRPGMWIPGSGTSSR